MSRTSSLRSCQPYGASLTFQREVAFLFPEFNQKEVQRWLNQKKTESLFQILTKQTTAKKAAGRMVEGIITERGWTILRGNSKGIINTIPPAWRPAAVLNGITFREKNSTCPKKKTATPTSLHSTKLSTKKARLPPRGLFFGRKAEIPCLRK